MDLIRPRVILAAQSNLAICRKHENKDSQKLSNVPLIHLNKPSCIPVITNCSLQYKSFRGSVMKQGWASLNWP